MRAFIALQLPQDFIHASSELAHKLSGTLRGRYLAMRGISFDGRPFKAHCRSFET
ncbi:MAG: hypothetical protein GX481_04730 [Atopobium sp.]|jgi:hypothetical protein|nr:hypothetical protein [Atopobium sp.]